MIQKKFSSFEDEILGEFNYYAKFINNYAAITLIIEDLKSIGIMKTNLQSLLFKYFQISTPKNQSIGTIDASFF